MLKRNELIILLLFGLILYLLLVGQVSQPERVYVVVKDGPLYDAVVSPTATTTTTTTTTTMGAHASSTASAGALGVTGAPTIQLADPGILDELERGVPADARQLNCFHTPGAMAPTTCEPSTNLIDSCQLTSFFMPTKCWAQQQPLLHERKRDSQARLLISVAFYGDLERFRLLLDNLMRFKHRRTLVVVHMSSTRGSVNATDTAVLELVRSHAGHILMNPHTLGTGWCAPNIMYAHLLNYQHAALWCKESQQHQEREQCGHFSHMLLHAANEFFFNVGVEQYVLGRNFSFPVLMHENIMAWRSSLGHETPPAVLRALGLEDWHISGFQYHEGAFVTTDILDELIEFIRANSTALPPPGDDKPRNSKGKGRCGACLEEYLLSSFILSRRFDLLEQERLRLFWSANIAEFFEGPYLRADSLQYLRSFPLKIRSASYWKSLADKDDIRFDGDETEFKRNSVSEYTRWIYETGRGYGAGSQGDHWIPFQIPLEIRGGPQYAVKITALRDPAVRERVMALVENLWATRNDANTTCPEVLMGARAY